MFSVEIKFKAGDREISLERFAPLFIKELIRTAQDEIRPQPIHERVKAPVISPAVVAAPASVDRKELEPLAVSLKQAAFLLGVKEPTIRKHMRQGTIPRVRVGKRVLVCDTGDSTAHPTGHDDALCAFQEEAEVRGATPGAGSGSRG